MPAAARSASSVSSEALGRLHRPLGLRPRRRPSSSTVAITVSEPASSAELAAGAEQALDLGRRRRPRRRGARASRRSGPTSLARLGEPAWPARARARRSRTCSRGAWSAVAIANSASGSASRQAVASSGRSSISSTISPGRLGGRGGAGQRAQQRRAARAGGGEDQHPLAEGERARAGRRRGRATSAVGVRRGIRRSGGTGGQVLEVGALLLGGSSPLTGSTWTRARWRSPRRGSRAGPATSSPGAQLAAADLGGGDVDVALGRRAGRSGAGSRSRWRHPVEHPGDGLGRRPRRLLARRRPRARPAAPARRCSVVGLVAASRRTSAAGSCVAAARGPRSIAGLLAGRADAALGCSALGARSASISSSRRQHAVVRHPELARPARAARPGVGRSAAIGAPHA